MKLKKLVFILIIIAVPILHLTQNVYGSDSSPPQLEISTQEGHFRNQFIILHGMAYDESGIQMVTVNGEDTKGTFTNVHYFWVKPFNLSEGVNTFTITAIDKSENHNTETKELVIWYHPQTYEGPSIKLIPISSQPSNNASISCIVNPNGYSTHIYLNYAEKGTDHSPFNSGRGGWSPPLTGYDDIVVTFKFERDEQPHVGTTIEYLFSVDNGKGFAYSEVGSFLVTEPIELPIAPDTTPPDSVVWDASGNINVPYVMVHGRAWDESGVNKVTVNGKSSTGIFSDNWYFWKKRVTLEEGPNQITVIAYDNNNNSIESTSTITYQKTGYNGPTIELVPHEDLPINNALIRCIINPRGTDNTGIYIDFYDELGHRGGQSLGHYYSGSEEIIINYVKPQERLHINDKIFDIVKVENSKGWSFVEINYTIIPPDFIAPEVVETYPKKGSHGISLDTDIGIIFNEHLDIFTLNTSTFRINGRQIAGVLDYNHEDHEAIFTPDQPLDYSSSYTVTLSKNISDYTGNQLSDSYSWNFTTVGPTIDITTVSDTRCDVNTTQYVRVHLSWGNGSAISSGIIHVNNSPFLVNQSGWITIPVHSDDVIIEKWEVTGIEHPISTKYVQLEDIPDIIWDKVMIEAPELQRVDIGREFEWSGKYEFDNEPFQGSLILNEPEKSTMDSKEPIRWKYTLMGIIDEKYGLTEFTANDFDVIYDKVILELSIEDDRIDAGKSPDFSISGYYAYDSTEFQGHVILTRPSEPNIGKQTFTVENISDPLYHLNMFESNEVVCIWDRVRITEGGVTKESITVKETATVWFKVEYEYDSEVFDNSKGVLYVNSEPMEWSSETSRWEKEYVSDKPQTISFEVTGVQDEQYGLSTFYDMVGSLSIQWKQQSIPSFPHESIILGMMVGILLLWWLKKRI